MAARSPCRTPAPWSLAASSGQHHARVLTGVQAPRSAPPPRREAVGLDAGSAHARPDWPLPTMPAPTPPPPVGRRRKRPRRKAEPAPHTDAHPGEPDPRRADEELPGQERGHAGRHVVPRDDGAVHVRGVVADEHRHGIGLGKRAGLRPGARDTHVADDQEGTDESVKHGAARRCSSSGPHTGLGAFPQGYIQTGATPPTTAGGWDTRWDTGWDTPLLAEPRQR